MNQVAMVLVPIPDNVTKLTGEIAEISGFQIVPTDEVDQKLFGLSKDDLEPFSDEFNRVGHETCLSIMNNGTP